MSLLMKWPEWLLTMALAKAKWPLKLVQVLFILQQVTKKTDAANACQEAKRLAAKLVMVSLEP